jgi:uncharacterized protein (UPF0261 family)
MVPSAGYDSYATEGEPLCDPQADAAFVEALRENAPARVRVVERPVHINDPAFATEAAETLIGLIKAKAA